MKQNAEFFGEQELVLIYIAKKLKEALKLESQLTSAGLDYLVEADSYRGGLIFVSQRIGAFFYVQPAVEEAARQVLVANGYRPFEKLEQPPDSKRP
jgi:hypothetical protein